MIKSTNTIKDLNLNTLADDFFLHNSFIEASAGTGKTYTIQHLLLKMIENDGSQLIGSKPISISEILLVTFTEKAAGELRNRIREILEEQYTEKLKSNKKSPSLIRINKALRSIDQAPIYTFHSFCDRVLSQYSFEAGIAENRQLVDKSYIQNLIERRCRDVWANSPVFEELICDYSVSQEKVISDLTQLLELYHPETQPLKLENEENLDDLLKQQKKTLPEAVNSLIKILTKKKVKLTRAKIDLNKEIALSSYGEASIKKDLSLHSDPEIQKTILLLASYNNKNQKEYDDYIADQIKNYKLNEFYQNEVIHLYKEWHEYKKNNSLKTFDDIIQTVYDHTNQKDSLLIPLLQKSYRYAIIDEFQDTNYFQWHIFKRLFLNAKSNRLIVVGDPKQSIYSFQEANIQVYQQALQEIGLNHGYRLSTNFRSSSSMVNSCNILFDQLFKDQNVSFTHSKVGKDESFQALFKNKEIPPLYFGEEESSPEEYTSWCVEQIQLLVNHIDIQNKKGEKKRLTYADIAILSRTRSEMVFIEKALATAGIPFTRYKDNNLFKSKECIHLATFLKAITTEDNSYTSQKIKRCALITPFVGKSLNEAQQFDFENREDSFFQTFAMYQNLAKRQAWPLLMESLFKNSQIEKTFLQEKKYQEIAKYRQLSEYVLECLTKKHWSLERVTSHLYNLHQEIETPIAEERELIARDTDQNMVQIMTIHTSKGLEFPVVFLVAGFKLYNSRGQFFCLTNPDDSLKRYIVASSEQNNKLHLNETIEESRRLFYVAMTRAQYLLFLPQITTKKNSPLDAFLKNTFTSYLSNHENPFLEAIIRTSSQKLTTKVEPENPLLDYKEEQDKLDLKFKRIKKEIENERGSLYCKSTSYSKIAHGKEHQTELGREDKAEEPEIIVPSIEDSILPKLVDFGNAVHEILEFIDFEQASALDSENLAPEIKNLIETRFQLNSLKPYTLPQIKLTASMIKNTLLACLPKLWDNADSFFVLGEIPKKDRKAEMQFNMGAFYKKAEVLFGVQPQEKPTWFFNGFIDLVFIVDGHYCILDWKTDSIQDYSQNGIENSMLKKNYVVQRALYSFALIEWLSSLKGVSTLSEKEALYDSLFGGVYYCFLRGTKAGTAQGYSCSRYPHYSDLLMDLQKQVSSRLINSGNIMDIGIAE